MDTGNGKDNEPWQFCKKTLEETPKNEWNSKKEKLLEILREEYRKTWTQCDTAKCLALCPSVSILDDHEIRDDWGWREEDRNSETDKPDYFYGTLARQVYWEYQRQLREDVDFKDEAKMNPEYHLHIFNGVGIMFIDYRGCRSWFYDKDDLEKTQLGKRQMAWIKEAFSPKGAFANVKAVLFVSPLPIFVFSNTVTKMAAIKVDDAKEQWAFGHQEEMAEMLDALRDWKEAKPGREVTLIGGDIHIGGHTDVFYKGKRAFKQFTSSAINNVIPTKFQFLTVRFMQECSQPLSNGYAFDHHDWTKENNYGIVTVSTDSSDQVTVGCKLVAGSYKGTPKELKEFDNHHWSKNKSGCCNIF